MRGWASPLTPEGQAGGCWQVRSEGCAAAGDLSHDSGFATANFGTDAACRIQCSGFKTDLGIDGAGLERKQAEAEKLVELGSHHWALREGLGWSTWQAVAAGIVGQSCSDRSWRWGRPVNPGVRLSARAEHLQPEGSPGVGSQTGFVQKGSRPTPDSRHTPKSCRGERIRFQPPVSALRGV